MWNFELIPFGGRTITDLRQAYLFSFIGNAELNMPEDVIDHLKALHTRAVDARNGYQEAVEDADGKGLTPLFIEMIRLHSRHADQLATALRADGVVPDEDGSFMSTIHRTIMNIRALFGGLGESVLPGLIDGEERNRSSYDEILSNRSLPGPIADLLAGQSRDLTAAIEKMEVMKEHKVKPPTNV